MEFLDKLLVNKTAQQIAEENTIILPDGTHVWKEGFDYHKALKDNGHICVVETTLTSGSIPCVVLL